MDLITKKATAVQKATIAGKYGYEVAIVNAFCEVEGSGDGFNPPTGKIIIQFEPAWFKRTCKDWQHDTQHVVWQANGIGNQAEEWKAFNDAFAENPDAAMMSTSVGIMQVMGFHYRELGFATVGAMWDFAKVSEINQIELALKFCKTIPALDQAIRTKDYHHIAYYYNGAGYKDLAIITHSLPYDQRIANAYKRFSAI